jgi:histidinol phosphatase-like PHP family hydrolase
MTARIVDCHAHTTLSDGDLTVAELAEQVRARGAVPSVADHISRHVTRAVDSVAAVDAYLDVLDQHDVLRGGEFCLHDGLWAEIPSATRARFTHVLGSLHAFPVGGRGLVHSFSRAHSEGVTPQAYMDALVEGAEAYLAVAPIDILGHPTLVNHAFRAVPGEELWTEEHEERLVAVLLRAGIAFEISNRYRAHDRLIGRAAAAGVRIALGSDGHTRDQVGDLAWPLAAARRAGIDDEDLYDPLRDGSRFR